MQLVIKVFSFCGDDTFIFDEEKQICLVNGNKKDINVSKTMQSLLNVLNGAKKIMVNNGVLDGSVFDISIFKNGKSTNYCFKNSFPKDFYIFSEILGGLKEC